MLHVPDEGRIGKALEDGHDIGPGGAIALQRRGGFRWSDDVLYRRGD